jgi:ParB family chromosome partitioning protein
MSASLPVQTRFITVPANRREIEAKSVEALAESMAKIGLLTPITIRANRDGELVLVAGGHRLAAALKLGWKEIDCIEFDGDEIDAELWEIAENLHRADLTVLQRSEQIARWLDLVEIKGAQVGHPGGEQPLDKGISKLARQTGKSRQDIQRKRKIGGLADKAKDAARANGLDNNQSVLEGAASKPDEASQVAYLQAEADRRAAEQARREAERHNRNQNRVIELTEAERFAEWLMERCDDSDVPMLVSWLEGVKPREVIAALRRQAA